MVPIRARRRIAWLLPLLFARLFVPAGFMLSTSGEGLGIALCPGYAPLPIPADAPASTHHHATLDHAAHAMHGGAHGPDGEQPSGHQGDGPTMCPFVLAGSTATCPPTQLVGELPRPADAVLSFNSHPAWISPAVLIDRIRGPPRA